MREMTEDELQAEQRRIAWKVTQFVGRDLNQSTILKIEGVVQDHIAAVRREGLDMPQLAVVFIPESTPGVGGSVDIVPRDLDRKGIETLIVNLAKKYPGSSARNIGFGINRAFPGYAKMVEAAERHRGWMPH